VGKMKTQELNEFKMGHFILWKGKGGFFTNRIRNHQKSIGLSDEASEYTHIDVSGGGPWVVRAMPPKIVCGDFSKIYGKGREYAVLSFKDSIWRRKKRYKTAFWAGTNVHQRYDILGIIKMKLPFVFHSKSAYFCSENALWALQKDYPKAMNGMKPYNCTPAHFFESKEFEVVKCGKL